MYRLEAEKLKLIRTHLEKSEDESKIFFLVLSMFLTALCLLQAVTEISSACSERRPSSMCLFSKELPKIKERFMPSVGNGYLATIVMSDTIHVAGLYNGYANITYARERSPLFVEKFHKSWDYDDRVAHRARIPSTAAINFTLDVVGDRSYALDLEHGVFYQWFDSKTIHIEQRVYAHRVFEHLLINEIVVDASEGTKLNFITNQGKESPDIKFDMTNISHVPYHAAVGKINKPELKFVTKVATAWTPIPRRSIIKGGSKRSFRFITSVSSNLHSSDVLEDSVRAWRKATYTKDLFTSHADRWMAIWNDSNITLSGNLYLSQLVPASLYYTLSQVNQRFPHGLSPGGLAGGEEYLGHVFWDQDVWMYPSILMLHPSIASSLLEYRQKRLNAAKDIARKYNYEGAMYPWESALSGYEVCPEHVYGLHEIHINGDIAFAQRQYFFATGDEKWLREKGYNVIYETATFWASRATYDPIKDYYVINNVMPPDEYAYPVNNSIYTNTIAKLNLETAIELGRLLNIKTPSHWEHIASKLYLPFDDSRQYHPEYEHFDIEKDTVKQADTILINYPLMALKSKQIKQNDLELYSRRTDPNGPAMTHSMFAIGWLDVDNVAKAAISLKRNFENVKGPFKVWSELRSGNGATNFITGAGGFVQAMIFGYGGIRLKSDGLYFKLQLSPETDVLSLNGVKYMGYSLQFQVSTSGCFVKVLKHASLTLYLTYGQKTVPMSRRNPIYTCNGKISAIVLL